MTEPNGEHVSDEADPKVERLQAVANDEWRRIAENVIKDLATRHDEFTTDSVWAVMDKKRVKITDPRLLGALMRSMSKQGVIIATSRTQKSERKVSHHRPVRVWKSLVR